MIEDKIQADGGIIEKMEIKKNSSAKKIINNVPKEPKQPSNPEYYCEYCKLFDKRL